MAFLTPRPNPRQTPKDTRTSIGEAPLTTTSSRGVGSRPARLRRRVDLPREEVLGEIDEFILSGYPHVEEAYWFAEGVRPILSAKGIYGADVQPRAALASA